MCKKSRPWMLGFTLLAAVALVAGCDRVKAITGKLKNLAQAKSASKGTDTTAPAATASTTPATATAPLVYSSDQVSAIDSSNYESFVSQKNKLIIVDFYADWCGPCRMMGPVLENVAAAHPGVVFVGKVNVDQARKLAAEHQVGSIPDVRIFKDGRQVERFLGFPGETAVREKIATLAQGITPVVVAQPQPAKRDSNDPEIRRMPKGWLPPGVQKR